MAKEIERKFLVVSTAYRDMAERSHHIVQGYLNTDPKATVRVRIKDDRAFLTIKGLNSGAVRDEWEYPIPLNDAREMLERCSSGKVIDKTRFIVKSGKHIWEIDEFHGSLEPLTIAEIELSDSEEPFDKPDFIGKEVTGDIRYYNSTLSK
jgi:CYTH domain-containing protein